MEPRQPHPQQLPLPLEIADLPLTLPPSSPARSGRILETLSRLILHLGRAQLAAAEHLEGADEPVR